MKKENNNSWTVVRDLNNFEWITEPSFYEYLKKLGKDLKDFDLSPIGKKKELKSK